MRVVNFEEFAARECLYFLDRDGLPACRCTHPANEEREIVPLRPGPLHVDIAACIISACPLGTCLHPETYPRDGELMKSLGFDSDGCSDETWMLLMTEAAPGA